MGRFSQTRIGDNYGEAMICVGSLNFLDSWARLHVTFAMLSSPSSCFAAFLPLSPFFIMVFIDNRPFCHRHSLFMSETLPSTLEVSLLSSLSRHLREASRPSLIPQRLRQKRKNGVISGKKFSKSFTHLLATLRPLHGPSLLPFIVLTYQNVQKKPKSRHQTQLLAQNLSSAPAPAFAPAATHTSPPRSAPGF